MSLPNTEVAAVPERMRAARLLRAEGVAGIELVDVPTPVPASDEVLVEVHAVGVNQLDLNTMSGRGPGAGLRLPLTLGADPAGVVVGHGDAVSPRALGRRVVVKPNIPCGSCPQCSAGHEADCPRQTIVGVHRDGGMAGYVAVPERNTFGIGDLDFAAASAAVHSAPIALHALRAAGGIRSGTWVLVTGATGTVGSAAVDLALDAGARVIAASTSRRVERAGVHPVLHRTVAELTEQVRALTPDGVDLAIDGSGHGELIAAGVACLGWRGRAVIVSASLHPGLQLDARDLYLRRKTVLGAASADYADVRDALDLVAAGTVRPAVDRRLPLDAVADAYAAIADRARAGKVVLDVR